MKAKGSKQKFYVVWEGKQPGIFSDWSSCNASVQGYPNAKYMAFESRIEAEKALKGNYWQFVKKREPLALKGKLFVPIPKGEALTVDAACSGNPGAMEYRGVWLESRIEYFRMGPYPDGTVNIGEFLAIVHGLAQLKKDGSAMAIYSDSKTAIKWVRDKRANTKLEQNATNKILFDYLARAERWLRENSYQNPVLKWETDQWGEIPADYGRK